MKRFILTLLFVGFISVQLPAQSSNPPAKQQEAKPGVIKRTTKKVVNSKPVKKTKKVVIKTTNKVGKKLQKVGN